MDNPTPADRQESSSTPASAAPRTPLDRRRAAELRQRGLRLEYATIAWNSAEVFVTIGLGIIARSLALVAFGLDSVIEVFASLVVVWHLRDAGRIHEAHRTRRAHRLVAAAFLALGAFLLIAAIQGLVIERKADASPVGIAYLALTAVVMFSLAVRKRSTSRELGTGPLEAEAAVTFLDAALATGILTALALNALFGWWWADPLAAIAVAVVAFDEGWENWTMDAPTETEPGRR